MATPSVSPTIPSTTTSWSKRFHTSTKHPHHPSNEHPSSPLNFISDPGQPINANGFEPSSSPYVVWSSCGGPNGTIVVSDADHSGVFINTMLGDPSGWRYKMTDARPSYSRAMAIWRNQPNKLAIFSAAAYDDAATNKSRPLTLDVMDLEVLVAANPPPEGPTPIQIYYPKLQRAV